MPERGTLSIQKARDLLGYEPTFDLDTGFRNYIDWYQEFAERNSALFAPTTA
jgi:nucleoside-diphosphate-sugar epimerase